MSQMLLPIYINKDHFHKFIWFNYNLLCLTINMYFCLFCPSKEHLSSTMIMETTPQISSTTMTTPELNVTTPTLQTQYNSSTSDTTSTEEVMYISTSTPPTGNVTMVHVNLTTPHTGLKSLDTTFTHMTSEGRTMSKIFCTSSSGSTRREINYVSSGTSTIIFTWPLWE